VRLLLDTQAFLYSIVDSSALPHQTRSLIESLDNDLLLSIASVWEMAIKISIGKLRLSQPLDKLIPRQLEIARISLLPISMQHATAVTSLPLYHRDPFDRMLVAQSMVEGVPLISSDTTLDQYAIERLW
jgi:PIN domain nuclease of toxin-antitoxin system